MKIKYLLIIRDFSHFFGYFADRMKKRSITYKIIKASLITLSIPIILFWLLMILLYMPPIQRFAIGKVCNIVNESTGFDLEIGRFHLAFPIKLNMHDVKVSKGDTVYADGKHADINISLLPLLSGDVEINYLLLEGVKVNTMELVPDMKIAGEIGFFRAVARNVDLGNELVNMRQLHLHSTNLDIELTDTAAAKEEEESGPLNWRVRLRNGNIENCRFNVTMPYDTLQASAGIGKIRIRNGLIDLGKEIYSISSFRLKNCYATYDQGEGSASTSPTSHLEINNINLDTRNILYTPDSSRLEIHDFTLIQPGGLRITETKAFISADTARLDLRKLYMASKNGSSLSLSAALPWEALKEEGKNELQAKASLALDKRDLGAILTGEQYESLSLLQEKMLIADMELNGSLSSLDIDSMQIIVPALVRMSANGNLRNLYDTKKLEATLNFNSSTGDIRKAIRHFVPADSMITAESDSVSGIGIFDIGGNVTYIAGEANADIGIGSTSGNMLAKARYNINDDTYEADLKANRLNIASLMPEIPLYNMQMSLKADGEGIDIFDSLTRYNLDIELDSLHYGSYRLNGISLKANQENGLSIIDLLSKDHNLQMQAKARTRLSNENISNRTFLKIERGDLTGLGVTEAQLDTRITLDLEASTDMAETHALKLNGKGIRIITAEKTYTPADIDMDIMTSPGYSYIKAKNGDMKATGSMNSGYTGLFAAMQKVAGMYMEARHADTMPYYLHDFEKALPTLSFDFECGKKNVLASFLAMNGLTADKASIELKLDTIKGLNMNSGIYGFSNNSLKLDTIRMFTRQQENKIRYLAAVRSTAIDPNNEKQSFSAALYGNVCMDSLSTNLMYRDKNDSIGIKIGAMTLMRPEGLDIRFNPEATLLKNRFRFNEDNFIRIGKGMSVDADVTLDNSKGAGMHLFTTPDPTAKYNANLELFNINLKSITSIAPFVPDIAGMLNLDLYFRQDDNSMLISSDIKADSIAYEGTYIGNEMLEVVYLPKNDKTHYLDIILSHEEKEVAHMSGNYLEDTNDPGLHGDITLTRFPLSISRAFLKDTGMELDGYINSELSAEGKLSTLNTNGFMQFDSVYIDAQLFGAKLKMADELVSIEDNKIMFKNFDIYSAGNNPFKINGNIDLTHIADPGISLRMRAKDYELINATRRKGAMLYGRLFIDFMSFISGTLNNMKIYGNSTLLSKSNITYVMLDAPIESDKELDGLVEFVNFKDTTAVAKEEEEFNLGNTNIDMTLNIEDGARINADFDENRSSYIALKGGGNLHLTYTSETGIGLTGTYSMSEGQLKYALPVIPLKTFNIADGSKVTWNGDIFNPDIDITALEKVITSVTFEDNSMQPVEFDVGVKLSNTLSNMGLTFTLSAPENAMVQEQLNMLDESTLNKYAVTMLITGTYIGSSNGMTASGALSSFLDAKINELAGNAMKSVSVNVGINDAQNAETGGTYKNYSFSFSKRFWNDRLTIIIGGEVNSGDHPQGSDSFINNVSLEWKISENSNRYIRLFYDKNYESILEGEIIETGVGYVYKRKLNNLNELLIFRKKDDKNRNGIPGGEKRSGTEENRKEVKNE